MQNASSGEENKSRKIILTGGHAATTALAVVEEIKKRSQNYELVWVGPRSAMEGDLVETAAEKVLKEEGVRIVTIDAGRLKRRGSWALRILAMVKVPWGFLQSFYYVFKIKPDAVVSFGGFAAFPVVFSAWLLKIPSLVHEQIVGLGLANRLSIPFARKITVARELSLQGLPSKKALLVGNPQVAKMFEIKKKEKIGSPPVIYVTGGSSGSQIINQVVFEALPKLLDEYEVFHQAGGNNYSEAKRIKEALPEKHRDKYNVFGYANPYDQASLIEHADIIIARSGANTVSDVVNSVRPTLFIPIPWTIGDEQTKNAQAAVGLGIAQILEQKDLTAETLLKKVAEIRKDWSKTVSTSQKGEFTKDKEAAQKLVSALEAELA